MNVTPNTMVMPTMQPFADPSSQWVPVGRLSLPLQPQDAQSTPAGPARNNPMVVEPPSTSSIVLSRALKTAVLGAVAGAGLTLLPFIPGGPFTGALIGAAAGAVVGAVRGVGHARELRAAAQALMLGSTNRAADPGTLGPEITTREAPALAARRPRTRARRRHVTVRRGDTLGAIARRHHTTVKALHDANRTAIGTNPNLIQVGLRLIVPS